MLILLDCYFPFLLFPFLNYITQFLLGIFLYPLLGNSFVTVLCTMAHFGGSFPQFFVRRLVYIHTFCYCSWKIIFKIELKPNFNIKTDTKKPLHLNTFSHIEMRYKYSTYSISPTKVKQDSETNLVNCNGSQMS